jgi:hypothetical protein
MNTAITFASLAHEPIWVAWKQDTRRGKPTPLPYDPRTGQAASVHDPATWATHEEADSWAATNGGDGVGLMLSQIDDAIIGGLELDSCRDPDTATVDPWAQEVIDRFDTYTETSPSQTGTNLLFIFARPDLPAVEALFCGKYGRIFKRTDGNGHPLAIEIHLGHRCFAVTGETISDTALRLVDLADLQWLISDYGPKFADSSASAREASQQSGVGGSGRALRIGVILAATGASYEDMRNALLTYADLEISEWARTQGMANGERELRRTTRLLAAIQACAWSTSSLTCNRRDMSTCPPVISGQRSASTRDCRRSRMSTAKASR